ncbi:hypothetical protein ACFTZI_00895 [Streptomyces decoyicus]|uniref:hypothetical protein n=1 Tax=Streptomyces decoyicus TaxID=249567 RepID=UPI003643311F
MSACVAPRGDTYEGLEIVGSRPSHMRDFAYYVDIATAMGDLPQPTGSASQWLDDADTVRERRRALVTARQEHLRGTQ